MKYNICKNNYKLPGDEPKCNRMCEDYSDFDPITNADLIRRMTDEELAGIISAICIVRDSTRNCPIDDGCNTGCYKCSLDWLKSEVKEEVEEEKYISETKAKIAVQNVLMDLGFEPLGKIANQFYEALENVKDYVER